MSKRFLQHAINIFLYHQTLDSRHVFQARENTEALNRVGYLILKRREARNGWKVSTVTKLS